MTNYLVNHAGYVAMVVLGFGFLVFIHEFGHFIVAKWRGVKVIKFSLGFGPTLVHYTIGETEYAISLVPLGGYCKLAGEMAGEKDDESLRDVPRERLLTSKTVGERAAVFAAGSIMNLLAAFPLSVAMLLVGGPEPVAKIVVNAGSGFVGGLQSGDFIIDVNGKPVHFWTDLEDAIDDAPVGAPFPVTVDRGGRETVCSVTRKDKKDYLGVEPFHGKTIGFVHPAGAAKRAGFRRDDEIIAVAKPGEAPVQIEDWAQFEETTRSTPGQELVITVRRPDPAGEGGFVTKDLAVTPREQEIYQIGVELGTEPVIGAVRATSPAAAAGIEPGDRVLAIDGQEIRMWPDLTRAVTKGGLTLQISLERSGRQIDTIVTRQAKGDLIGVAAANPHQLVTGVTDGSPASAAGMQPGDTILKIGGKPLAAVVFANDSEKTIEIRRGRQVLTLQVKPEKKIVGQVGVGYKEASEFRRSSLLAAIPDGFAKAGYMFGQTMVVLYRLFTGHVSTNELAGPIGIITLSYSQAETGLQDFIRILMMISISLGVFNLLPIPVLDGGHLLFLGIENIRGKPVSERTFIAAQKVGLALLLGLVLFVTRNDFINFIL